MGSGVRSRKAKADGALKMKHVFAQAVGLLAAVAGIGLATGSAYASLTAAGVAVVVVSTALEAASR